jgi:predicted RNase H-like nuclease (RuvC/YqgF family)
MKSILAFIFSCLLTLSSFSQSTSDSTSYPQYYVVNGDTVGVILTIEQLQKIDNDLEIKNLLEKSLIDCDSLSSQYIVVVSKLENRVTILEVKNSELLKANEQQDQIIKQLNLKVSNYEKDLNLCDEQSKKKDTIISNQQSTINKLLIGGGALNLGLLVILVAIIL